MRRAAPAASAGQLCRWSLDGVLLVPKSDSAPLLMCEGLSAKTDPSQKAGPVMGWRLLPPAAPHTASLPV